MSCKPKFTTIMRSIIILLGFVFIVTNLYSQVGINTTSPGTSAILDINSSDKGVLFPRVALTSTTVKAPVTDAENGVFIFNTATAGSGDTSVIPGYYWWNSVDNEWERFTDGEQGNHYVGELYGGGIVFYVYENGNHGLIASFDDLGPSSGSDWGNRTDFTGAESWWDGETNTNVAAPSAAATDAVKLCYNYSNGGYSDWHLPSIGELKALEDAAYVLFKVLDSDGDSNTNAPNYNGEYWSSTQDNIDDAYAFKFTNTHTEIKDKDDNYLVRAVRAF